MPQPFRHVIRDLDPQQVEELTARHAEPWWRARALSVRVRGGRIRAVKPGGRFQQPPVLRGTLTPDRRGTRVEGRLHRGASGFFNAVFGVTALTAIGFGIWLTGSAEDEAFGIGAIVVGLVFGLIFLGLAVSSLLVRGVDRRELGYELDRFYAAALEAEQATPD